MKIRVKIPSEKDPRFKSWARTIDFVKIEHDNAYAFEGSWLRRGTQTELPLGSLVLTYDETGTRQKQVPRAEVFRVNESGLYGPLLSVGGVDWVMQIRDEVAELLEQELPPPDLSDVSTNHLLSEILSRIDTKGTPYNFREDDFAVETCGDCSCAKIVTATKEHKKNELRRVLQSDVSPAVKKPASKKSVGAGGKNRDTNKKHLSENDEDEF